MKRSHPQQPKVRSTVARQAWFQTGGGAHGGSSRQQNRRERQSVRQSLRKDY